MIFQIKDTMKRYRSNEMDIHEINNLLNFDTKKIDNLTTIKEHKKINELLQSNRIDTDTNNLLNFCINSLKVY